MTFLKHLTSSYQVHKFSTIVTDNTVAGFQRLYCNKLLQPNIALYYITDYVQFNIIFKYIDDLKYDIQVLDFI